MSNRNFNKQTTNARQGFASGSMVKAISEAYKPKGEFSKKNKKSTSKELKAMEGFRKVSPKLSKGDKMKEQIIGSKEFRDKLRKFKSDMRKKKYAPEFKKKSTLLPKSRKPLLAGGFLKKGLKKIKKKIDESKANIREQGRGKK